LIKKKERKRREEGKGEGNKEIKIQYLSTLNTYTILIAQTKVILCISLISSNPIIPHSSLGILLNTGTILIAHTDVTLCIP